MPRPPKRICIPVEATTKVELEERFGPLASIFRNRGGKYIARIMFNRVQRYTHYELTRDFPDCINIQHDADSGIYYGYITE